MTTYNTGNPLGSSAAKDLYDNAENLDDAVNSTNKSWNDRFGRTRRSMSGIDYDANQSMINYGYITKKSFELGATLDTPNTVLQLESNGEYYRWDGDWSQPKIVPAGSTPASSGGEGFGKWVGVGDASLRNDLSSDKYLFVSPSQNYSSGLGKLIYGPGNMTYGGITFTGFLIGIDVPHSSFYLNPEDSIYGANIGFPADGNGNFNAVMSTGSHPETATGFNRSTAFGTNNFTKPVSVDRCEAIGNSALMFMRYGERNTMVGSIAGQWLGTNDPQGDGHEMWSNAGGFTPGQPGWDYSGFETANPGIGAKIAASTAYATTSAECARNVGMGRNAFNGSVKLMNCTAVGYRALASAYFANNSSAFGTDAFRSGLFLNESTGMGYAAGTSWQEGERNLVLGNQAGVAVIKGSRNTLVGPFSGSDSKEMNDCIFIGSGAGNDVIATTPSPSNILAIGNDVSGVGSPLIVGNMAVPKAGINILPEKIAGTFHIRSSDQTASPVAPSGAADDLVLENGGNTGMTIRSSATGLGSLNFSSPTSATAASLNYNHSTSSLTFRANSADRWIVNGSSLNPAADNVYSVGLPSLRPSQIYAGNSSISTSDATHKTEPREISAAEISAFSTIMRLPGVWQWLQKYQSEGDEARLHSGPTVQAAIAIMSANGLDWTKYSAFCFDKWEDKYTPIYATRTASRKILKSQVTNSVTGEVYSEEYENVEYEEEYDTGEKELVVAAGSLYSFRKEELTWWCMRSLASQIDDLTNRVQGIEKAMSNK